MADLYHEPVGEIIAADDLTVPKTQDLCRVLRSEASAYMHFLEARRIAQGDGWDVLVFEVEVELPQRPVHDIRRYERIAVACPDSDMAMPVVLALRTDFPHVPHMFPASDLFPATLCLYEQPFSELRLTWSPTGYLQRVRDWLALTARGELHGQDQPLERLLLADAPPLLLPHDLTANTEQEPEHLLVHARERGNGKRVYVAERPGTDTATRQEGAQLVALVLGGAPQAHGILHRTPRNLLELHHLLLSAGMDVHAQLACCLKTWCRDPQKLKLPLMLIVILPKTRDVGTEVETEELYAFLCGGTVSTVGVGLGLWEISDGYAGMLIGVNDPLAGEHVELEILNPTLLLSRERAAQLNGRANVVSTRIVAVGLGALGSQVFMNLIRAGYGQWTLLDHDYLLPHNLARHALPGFGLGNAKVDSLATIANHTVAGPAIAEPIVADILAPHSAADAVHSAMIGADVIVDMSASVAVGRHLARETAWPARRISLFLNPTGTDLVLLAEDKGRQAPVDWLEMLYYRHLCHDPAVANHLRLPSGRVRYAQGCRDVSSVLPQDLVALHAALGSRGVQKALSQDEATIMLWQDDQENISVTVSQIATTPIIQRQVGAWTLCTDQWLIDRVTGARAKGLPNETGGVLIGCFDMQRRIVYVVDVLESPPDSTEWPTLYIRGCAGLPDQIKDFSKKTGAVLCYVGEWHCHPEGSGPQASTDDRQVFDWLSSWMSLDDRPALMLIVGETAEWYLGTVS